MPNTYLPVVLAYTCLLPAIAGLFYYKLINRSYHPFIWAMCLSVFTELFTNVWQGLAWPDAIFYIMNNTYYILYFFLYLLFFYRQKVISKEILTSLLLLGATVFIINGFLERPWLGRLHPKSILYVLIIIGLAGILLSRQIFNTFIPVHRNALFIICCSIMLSVFYVLYHLLRAFNINYPYIQSIMQYANALMYFIFFPAILCIPKKSNTAKAVVYTELI